MSSIRNSMLRHWRNNSLSLGRSGSKKEKDGEKSYKRRSTHIVPADPTATNSLEPRTETTAPEAAQKQMDDSVKTSDDAAPPPKGVSVHVTICIAPENVEKFLAAFKTIFDIVVTEPECLFFEVYRSIEEPGKISWIENWSKDMPWLLENQITKPYYKEYLEMTEPLFLKPREVQIWEPLGPGFSVVKGSKLSPRN